MRTAILCLGLAAIAGTAPAQSLGQKMIQRDEQVRLAERAADLPGLCEAEIATEIDFSTFADDDYDNGKSISGFCEGPLSAIRQLCNDPLGKEAVQAKVKTLVCTRSDGPTAELGEDGTYRYGFGWDDHNQHDWHVEFLKDNL